MTYIVYTYIVYAIGDRDATGISVVAGGKCQL